MSSERGRTPSQLTALVAILALETLLLIAATAFLVWELAQPGVLAPVAIALTVTTAVFAALVLVVTIGTARRWRHVRGATLLWQLLQIACAVGAFQGLLGPEWIGWPLLVPAVAAIWLLFTKPVTSAFVED